jgi:hypothetical protein
MRKIEAERAQLTGPSLRRTLLSEKEEHTRMVNIKSIFGMGLVSLAAALGMVGCGGSDSNGETPPLGTHISRVTSSDGSIVAQLHSGSPPASGSGGPTVTATSAGLTLPGGSKIYELAGTASFTAVYLAIDGVDGYYVLTGLGASGSNHVVVSIGQNASSTFTLLFGISADGTAAPGAYETVPVTLTQVGTGDVQVSLTWSVPADIDLHVVEPSGEEICWEQESSVSGGALDMDSNAGCGIDNKDNENITWASGTAPRGTYIVRVDNWSVCGVTAPIDYVVTVNVKGKATQTFQGTFTGAGDEGGIGAGVEITRFTY